MPFVHAQGGNEDLTAVVHAADLCPPGPNEVEDLVTVEPVKKVRLGPGIGPFEKPNTSVRLADEALRRRECVIEPPTPPKDLAAVVEIHELDRLRSELLWRIEDDEVLTIEEEVGSNGTEGMTPAVGAPEENLPSVVNGDRSGIVMGAEVK